MDGFRIIGIIVLVAVGIVLYSIYKFFVPMYFGLTLVTIIILFSAALILMMKVAKDSFSKLENLSTTLDKWIRNEDIRRDIEVLPFFIEEKKKEYYRGLHEGYNEVEKIHRIIDDLKVRVEELTDKLLLEDVKAIEEQARKINELVKSVNIAVTNLKLRNSKKKISYDMLRLRLR